MLDHSRTKPQRGFWLLHTADMHGLYAKLGFGEPSIKLMERLVDFYPAPRFHANPLSTPGS